MLKHWSFLGTIQRVQREDMRIELWNLFREDVRDVFECTRANMDNYMVVGTLIIASVPRQMRVDANGSHGTSGRIFALNSLMMMNFSGKKLQWMVD